MVPTLYLFDRWDERVGVLPTLGSMTHTEEVGGEDTVEIDCLAAPEKGDRLVWRDPEDGRWREHEVVRTDEPLEGACHVYAESSLCELLRDYVVEEQLVGRTAAQAMAAVLARTRWSSGNVTVGDAKRSALLYHTNALAALRRVASVWGGELLCELDVEGGRVARRRASLLSRVGGWHGARFSYGRNLAGCTRTVLEGEVFTALYGWGKGLPIEDAEGNPTGGYTEGSPSIPLTVLLSGSATTRRGSAGGAGTPRAASASIRSGRSCSRSARTRRSSWRSPGRRSRSPAGRASHTSATWRWWTAASAWGSATMWR